MPTFSGRAREGSGGRAPCPSRLRREDGFTLFETLVAAVILVVGLMGLFGLLDTSLKATASTRAREGATNLAREILEDAHITYTVKVSECSIDDPKDGYGKHVNSLGENPFCEDSKTEEGKDQQPEDLKRVTVDVTWSAIGRSPDVHQVETVTAAGEAPGLNATSLKLTVPKVGAPTAPVIVAQPLENKLTFSVQAPSATAAMTWALDGVKQSPAPTYVSANEWTFSWFIPEKEVTDGTYTVAAQAISATGIYGPPVSISVTLIRSTPAAPKVTNGGFNEVIVGGKKTTVVELQWVANAERNVLGYQVRNSKGELVCPSAEATLSLAVTCTDFNLPAKAVESNQVYKIAALYRKAEGEALSKEVSSGPATSFTAEKGPPPGPNVPGAPLTATKNADASVTLKWSAPSGGAAVAFYRIYRGSEEYKDREGVVIAPTTEYTDTNAASEHSYWVTAVNANLKESPYLGPVTK
jgi:hypothetical protein